MNKTILGYFMIFISAIGFGSYGVWSRLIGAEFGVFYHAWVRSALVLAILIPIALATKQLKKVDRKDMKWFLVPVLFGIFTQAPLYYAFNNMNIGTATLVFYALFVITSYAVGSLFFREKITLVKIISFLLACSGLVMIFGFSLAQFSLLALLLAGVNGIASGGEVSTTKKTSDRYSSLQLSIYIWGGILLTHLPISLFLGEKQLVPSLEPVWLAMYAFAVAGLLSFWLVVEGFKYADASIGSLIGLFEIMFGVLFGVLVFNEIITFSAFLGGILITVAAMLPDITTLIRRSARSAA